jgi:hypothetical protein
LWTSSAHGASIALWALGPSRSSVPFRASWPLGADSTLRADGPNSARCSLRTRIPFQPLWSCVAFCPGCASCPNRASCASIAFGASNSLRPCGTLGAGCPRVSLGAGRTYSTCCPRAAFRAGSASHALGPNVPFRALGASFALWAGRKLDVCKPLL